MVDSREPDWYLKEWAALRGKKQADLVSELGWHATTAHRLWHGRQPYRRDVVNTAAAWLGIAPWELLMPPAEAMALRGIRESALAIAAEDGRKFEHGSPASPKPDSRTRGRRRYG